MKHIIAAIVAAAGMCTIAGAVVNTRIDFQVSLDGVNWFASVDATTGTAIAVRALVTYTGTGSPAGLASLQFQPTMSYALSSDIVLPFINGGQGGNTSTPPGVISGAQLSDVTSFGRTSPWGRVATSSSSAIRGYFHTNPNGDGIDYLRIAQSNATSWIGGAGNTTGGKGVNIAQLSDIGRTTSDPAFTSSLTNVYVFKWGVVLGPGHTAALFFDAPLEGFGNYNSTTGEREVYWFADRNEDTGSIHGTAIVNAAAIYAPAPASAALLAIGVMATGRRGRGPRFAGRFS